MEVESAGVSSHSSLYLVGGAAASFTMIRCTLAS